MRDSFHQYSGGMPGGGESGPDLTSWFSSGDGWMALGLLLIVAAAIGTGGKLISWQLPVVKTTRRQMLVAVLGVAFAVYGYQANNFRVTKLALEVTPSTHDEYADGRNHPDSGRRRRRDLSVRLSAPPVSRANDPFRRLGRPSGQRDAASHL